MADIELVVKIPEEKLSMIKNKIYCGIYDPELYEGIANGTPLPKGHGRLIDANAYEADVKKHYFDNSTVIRCTEIALNYASTILEASND